MYALVLVYLKRDGPLSKSDFKVFHNCPVKFFPANIQPRHPPVPSLFAITTRPNAVLKNQSVQLQIILATQSGKEVSRLGKRE